MKHLVLLLLVCGSLSLFSATPIGLKDAIAKGYITVTAVGEGGFTGKVMALNIESLTKKELTIDIPVGLTLDSEDDGMQDLIITDDRQLVLAAGTKRKVVVNAMCIQPSNGSPSMGSSYLLGAMAGDTLLKLVQYLALKNYQDDLGQSAVWTIINKDGLENVYGSDPAKLKDLVIYMNKLTGKPLPWYNKEKAPPAAGQVFNQEPAVVHAAFEFTLAMAGTAKLAVYDEAGEMVFLIKDNMMVKSGKSVMKFRFEVRGYEKAKYYVRLHLNGKLQEEKVIEL
ncbi:hypothetical protein BH09BAC1_BH09BAC1_17710 [soil metagenome]